MKSYKIQHDFLYKDLPLGADLPLIPLPAKKGKLTKATPIKVSFLLRTDTERLLLAYSWAKKPIMLLDDLPKEDNQILNDYKDLLIRAIIFWFSKRATYAFVK